MFKTRHICLLSLADSIHSLVRQRFPFLIQPHFEETAKLSKKVKYQNNLTNRRRKTSPSIMETNTPCLFPASSRRSLLNKATILLWQEWHSALHRGRGKSSTFTKPELSSSRSHVWPTLAWKGLCCTCVKEITWKRQPAAT